MRTTTRARGARSDSRRGPRREGRTRGAADRTTRGEPEAAAAPASDGEASPMWIDLSARPSTAERDYSARTRRTWSRTRRRGRRHRRRHPRRPRGARQCSSCRWAHGWPGRRPLRGRPFAARCVGRVGRRLVPTHGRVGPAVGGVSPCLRLWGRRGLPLGVLLGGRRGSVTDSARLDIVVCDAIRPCTRGLGEARQADRGSRLNSSAPYRPTTARRCLGPGSCCLPALGSFSGRWRPPTSSCGILPCWARVRRADAR